MKDLIQLARIFIMLILYSFIGWVYESTLCSITGKVLVNRGFLNGPICPIYGFGAIIIVLTLNDVNSIFALFLSSMILTTLLEYVTSYVMEKCFNAKWWDYSYMRFNVNGRVCLLGAVVFGVMSVVIVTFVHPFVESKINAIPISLLLWGSGLIFVLVSADLYITISHLLKLNGKLEEIQAAIDEHKAQTMLKAATIKAYVHEKFETSEKYSARIIQLIEDRRFIERRLMSAFPHMTSTKYKEALEKIKYKLNSYKDK